MTNSKPQHVNRRTRRASALLQRSEEEVDRIYAEFANEMEKLRGSKSGAIYARYSSRFQDSIGAQVRANLTFAVQKGIYVARKHIFFDVAVRGSKARRDGLEKATRIIQHSDTKILLVFKTNRLFRKTYRALEFVDRVVNSWQARIIFIKDNLDSSDPDFGGIRFQVLAMLDEHGAQVHVDNIQAAHLHMFADDLIHGTVTFGYDGEEIPGTKTKRGRCRRRWCVHERDADYVKKIFKWFVEDELKIAAIVQRLNGEPDVPLPPKSEGAWTRLAVTTLLENERYLGIFKHGDKQRVDLPDVDYTIQRKREEPLAVKLIDELQIIDDELWKEAQLCLARLGRNGGRPKGIKSQTNGSEIIRGLFRCPEHDCAMWISGKSIFCKICQGLPRSKRHLYTRLNTKLAVQLLVERLTEILLNDRDLMEKSYEYFVQHFEQLLEPDPGELPRLQKRDNDLGNQIKFTKRNVGESAEEMRESEELLRELRAERQDIRAQLARLEKASSETLETPTLDQFIDRLRKIADDLLAAPSSKDQAQLGRVRRLIRLLTGGNIELHQCGGLGPKQGWLKATVQVHLPAPVADQPVCLPSASDPYREIEIEFKLPRSFQQEADMAYELDQQGDLHRIDIARKLGCSKSKITKLLKFAHEQRGEAFTDGRSRKSQLPKKTPAVFEAIADEVMGLYDNGLLMQEIADQVGVCKDTITKVVRHWHESRGLAVPDGRERRKSLSRKSRTKRK